MPKCPKCGKEIDYLVDYSPAWQKYEMRIDKNGDAHYEFVDDSLPIDTIDDEYECPECSEVLFTDEEEAVKFLKGEISEKRE